MATSETPNKSTIVIQAFNDDSCGAYQNENHVHSLPHSRDESKIEVVWIPLNLLDNESVRIAADAIKRLATKIHIVINNAGVMAVRGYTTSKQGIEGQFAANYLGHFLLTNLLMDQMVAARDEGPTIINVGSLGYELGDVKFDDINFEEGRKYNAWKAFGQSKTAILLWSTALAKRLNNKGVVILVVHPGTSSSAFIVDERVYTETKGYANNEQKAEKIVETERRTCRGNFPTLESGTESPKGRG
ncbi:hypothetical protein DID88_008834 [Monilinia fructigena]|uniref:Oxidoreductase n=1 Tax=Monilinia fructigena TaxID=38457 RepID=A0A395J6J8_9HELO|nr:hypothetical protein DID88_008834 [Monilinia fructigena]